MTQGEGSRWGAQEAPEAQPVIGGRVKARRVGGSLSPPPRPPPQTPGMYKCSWETYRSRRRGEGVCGSPGARQAFLGRRGAGVCTPGRWTEQRGRALGGSARTGGRPEAHERERPPALARSPPAPSRLGCEPRSPSAELVTQEGRVSKGGALPRARAPLLQPRGPLRTWPRAAS